jgi:hypothetical protein
MANIKFKLEENILTQVVKDTGRYIGKGIAASLLAGVTGSPAAGLAAFNSIKNMMYDKKTYKTEQEKEKVMNNLVKSYGEILSQVEVGTNKEKLSKVEISVVLDFINDYFEKIEQEYRKNLNRKYTQQELISDLTVQLRKRLTYGDVKNAKDWIKDGAKVKGSDLFKMLANNIISILPKYKELELIKRKKAGQYYSPDAK